MDDQQKECLACRQCCIYDVLPLNVTEDVIKLLWWKGHDLIYYGDSRKWYMVMESPCAYITDDGCTVYDLHDVKPKICDNFMCFCKNRNWLSKLQEDIAITQELLVDLFGQKPVVGETNV